MAHLKGILSEFPYMALTFAALAFHQNRRDKAADAKSSIALGLLLAAVLLTRAVGVTLVAAVAMTKACITCARGKGRACSALPLRSPSRSCRRAVVCTRPAGGGEDLYGSAWTLLSIGANASALVDAWLNALSSIGVSRGCRPLSAHARSASPASAQRCGAPSTADPMASMRAVPPSPALLAVSGTDVSPRVPGRTTPDRERLWGVWQQSGRSGASQPRNDGRSGGAVAARAVHPGAFLHRDACLGDGGGRRGLRLLPLPSSTEFPAGRRCRDATMELEVLEDMERIRASTPESSRVMWFMPATWRARESRWRSSRALRERRSAGQTGAQFACRIYLSRQRASAR